MRHTARLALVALLAAGAAGCSRQENVSFKAITSKPAPEMHTTSQTGDAVKGDYAYMRNTNQRGLWDDLSRALLLDNPTRLSPYPTVDASGNPR